jgi:serine/threonine protein phosphatase PrpC
MNKLIPQGFAATDVGKARKRNEDAWLIDEDLGLYMVADGMGGHAGGAEASSTCVRALRESLYQQLASGATDPRSAPGRLTRAVEYANQRVRQLGRDNPEIAGCGTTITALAFVGEFAWVAHVGDSRCYHYRDGELWLVTSDHTVAEQRVRAGYDKPEDVASHDHILLRAIGSEDDVQVDVTRVPVLPGDRFLLCSDGLTLHLSAREIRQTLGATNGEAAVNACIWTALERGGQDNVTAIVVEV